MYVLLKIWVVYLLLQNIPSALSFQGSSVVVVSQLARSSRRSVGIPSSFSFKDKNHRLTEQQQQQQQQLFDKIRSSSSSTALFAKGTIRTWDTLEGRLASPLQAATLLPVVIDSAFDPTEPSYPNDRPTLFRERHGWCPYSERVWMTLELFDIPYDTVRIDNTGHGPRPAYYSGGQTPQIKWPESSRRQGESMDLVKELNKRYETNCGDLYLKGSPSDDQVEYMISQFRNIFPRARPSSRAAYLFQYNGEALWKSSFETTLEKTDQLLGSTEGPYFCGAHFTAADIAWAPFLERYRYQLPCLHQGLIPYNAVKYPHLAAWYHAMDTQPEHAAYACRVKGDAASWRKVLCVAGYGNGGVPPEISRNMDALAATEVRQAKQSINVELWKHYAASRPYVADTPAAEAALIMLRNRHAIVRDTAKRMEGKDEGAVDLALRQLVKVLLEFPELDNDNDDVMISDSTTTIFQDEELLASVGWLASFLDDRMCVPRDMGAMSAACIKLIAWNYRQQQQQ